MTCYDSCVTLIPKVVSLCFDVKEILFNNINPIYLHAKNIPTLLGWMSKNMPSERSDPKSYDPLKVANYRERILNLEDKKVMFFLEIYGIFVNFFFQE